MICSWHENLPKDEIPPRWMWAFDELVSKWFKEVEVRRENKYKNTDNDSKWEETDLDENAQADEYKKSLGLRF